MPGRPRKGRRFGGSSQHQRLMMANLAASLFAAEGITTGTSPHTYSPGAALTSHPASIPPITARSSVGR